jgi:hypothetical protein
VALCSSDGGIRLTWIPWPVLMMCRPFIAVHRNVSAEAFPPGFFETLFVTMLMGDCSRPSQP